MPLPIILDSGVFTKSFLQEDDTPDFMAFMAFTTDQIVNFFAPSLFIYEVIAVLLGNGVDGVEAHVKLQEFTDTRLELAPLDEALTKQAIEIASTGHDRAGYPSFYDAVYHALAIQKEGVFLTSDKRHYRKVKDFGHVCLLENWQDIFA